MLAFWPQQRLALAGAAAMKKVNGSDYDVGLSHALMGCEFEARSVFFNGLGSLLIGNLSSVVDQY